MFLNYKFSSFKFFKSMILSNDKLSDKTTSKDHFKQWNQNDGPVKAFNEWPSYAGDSLFPTAERNFATTTGTFHPIFQNVQRTKSFVRLENKGSLTAIGNYLFIPFY